MKYQTITNLIIFSGIVLFILTWSFFYQDDINPSDYANNRGEDTFIINYIPKSDYVNFMPFSTQYKEFSFIYDDYGFCFNFDGYLTKDMKISLFNANQGKTIRRCKK